MIAFVSLFLGLMVGAHDVELIVEGDVAEVAVYLDGVERQVLREPPWTFSCDFGAELAPHDLLVVARDDAGREIARARQLINLPRGVAELAILLEGEDRRRPEAGRLLWRHLEFEQAERVRVELDGEPLEVGDDRRFPLPELDPTRLHELVAQVTFPDGGRYRTEVRFGGPRGAVIDARLTAVPIAGGGRTPSLAALDGRLTVGGETLAPVAIEQAPAKLVVVVDPAAAAALRELAQYDLSAVASLRAGEQVEFFFPFFRRGAGARLFHKSQTFFPHHGGLGFLITHVKPPEATPDLPITDAIAAAAIAAAEGGRPRVVILLLSEQPDDLSAFGVDEVLAFCRDLRVPLAVWSIGRGAASRRSEDRRRLYRDTPWGRARDVTSTSRFAAAVVDLRAMLDDQHVVWVEGSHRPDEIELAPGKGPWRLVGVAERARR